MKEFLLFALLASLSVTAASAQNKWREVDLRINGVGSGSSYTQVLSNLGKPTQRRSRLDRTFEGDCLGEDSTTVTLDYPGLQVVLLGDGNGRKLSVVEMRMTSGRRSASGIQLGATPAQVGKRFGKPNSIEREGTVSDFFYVTRENLGIVKFRFVDGKLTMVGMSETLC